MNIAMFSSKKYEKDFFNQFNKTYNFDIEYFEVKLNIQTASLAKGFEVVVCFVNDNICSETLSLLANNGVKLIALRCAGFNNVDLEAAKKLDIKIVRVPAYSPYAVAEFTVGLILSLNRKFNRAYMHVQEHNFSLQGLMGFDLHGKTVGIIGTGRIGEIFAKIMTGFGCQCIAYDVTENPACIDLGVNYVSLNTLYQQADIISLHCPLTTETKHLINSSAIEKMKSGVMLINTSRGLLIDTRSVIEGIKSKKIGFFGMDVYEEEENLFFEDLSDQVINDDTFTRLQTFPNVFITGHQAFFTEEAMHNIVETTLENINSYINNSLQNSVN
jgi:D-lactate dehydrogenase